jgi:hypothetical protein
MREEAPWTLDELAIVADYYKEPLREILEPALTYKYEEAVLLVDDHSSPCLVMLGDPVKVPCAGMVALGVPGNYIVAPGASMSFMKLPARAVRELKVGAVLPVGETRVQCEASIGNPIERPTDEPLVAYATAKGFLIAPPGHVDDRSLPVHEVHCITIKAPKAVADAEPPEAPLSC